MTQAESPTFQPLPLTDQVPVVNHASATALGPVPIDVISLQSQVVYGRVGNNAAVPALQGCGLRVVALPTIILSNTPHYPTFHGGPVPDAWLTGWLDDLEARGITAGARVVQVGYLGHVGQAELLADWWRRTSARHPQLRLHLDPVLGDRDSGLYTAPGLLEAWSTQLVPLAHGLTPNRFELEQLAGTPLHSVEDCRQAARALLRGPTQWIAITSVQDDAAGPQVQTLLETRDGSSRLIAQPRVDCAAKGTGDYFAARVTGHHLNGMLVADAAERAALDTAELLSRTLALGWEELALDTPLTSAGDSA